MKESVSAPSFVKRCIVLVAGLFVVAVGIALSAKASLGISPVSCLPYVLSNLLPMTVGQLTICLHAVLILLQILLLRKSYRPIQLAQLALAIVFGYFIDFANFLFSGLQISAYPVQVVACLASCILIGFGVFLEVRAGLVTLAAEGLAKALEAVTGREFGKMKIAVDVTLVSISIVISLIAFRSLNGVREGTVAAAILVGMFVRVFNRHDAWLVKLLNQPRKVQDKSPAA